MLISTQCCALSAAEDAAEHSPTPSAIDMPMHYHTMLKLSQSAQPNLSQVNLLVL